jgi:hypothetical protein
MRPDCSFWRTALTLIAVFVIFSPVIYARNRTGDPQTTVNRTNDTARIVSFFIVFGGS